MGADFRWALCAVSAQDVDRLGATFSGHVILSPANVEALEAFAKNPEAPLAKWSDATPTATNVSPHLLGFTSLFTLAEFANLFLELPIDETHHVALISGVWAPPMAALFIALGARSALLPGYLGNALIEANLVPKALKIVSALIDSIDSDGMHRACRLNSCRGEPREVDDPKNAAQLRGWFSAYQSALTVVENRGVGLASFSFWLG
jgi:hypothetical protein